MQHVSTLRPGFGLGSLGSTLARLGPAKLGAMAVVAAAAILAVVLVARAPQATNGLLYAGLEPSSSRAHRRPA